MSEKKTIVLIGGSYGIGAALAQLLLDKSYDVYVLSRSAPTTVGTKHITLDVQTASIDLSQLPGKIDGLAYLPGSIQLKPFHRFTNEEFLQDLNINVLGAAKCVRDLLNPLKAAEQSSIVFFSTVAVQQGMPFHASVAMAKGALEGLTRSLAAEFAPKIRVNAIAPSITDTPLASKILSSEDKKKVSGERHPLKRVGEARDIAQAAAYLLTDESSWISGQVIHVDGGLSALRV
ncbi:MAG: SDR family oxidoreductase [Cyclobacteriaceae bacterium]|nr:SDR family oxidoreductase [Cyclobacteriaceae bacterium]MBX2955507.1 SDR family oxidoreductase [Cyclobacteriaceae bacterium]